MVDYGKAFRVARHSQDHTLTVKEAADGLSISYNYLLSIEKGNKEPGRALIEKAAAFYDFSIDVFLGLGKPKKVA